MRFYVTRYREEDRKSEKREKVRERERRLYAE